jgi:hypothetical protein
MFSKSRSRGHNIRYIKNPSRTFFRYSEPLSEVRAIKGQHLISKTKTSRQPQYPDRNTPGANKPHQE